MQAFLEWHANRKNYGVIKRMEMSCGNLKSDAKRQTEAFVDRQFAVDDSGRQENLLLARFCSI